MKKRRFTKNGVEYWIDDKNFLMGGRKCEPLNDDGTQSQEDRIKEFKELINSKSENESLLMWETTKSVTAHDYYDYYIQEHQELEEYEECARLLKLKNQIPYSEELTHTIKKSGGKLMNKKH